jgi:hypothetical protein
MDNRKTAVGIFVVIVAMVVLGSSAIFMTRKPWTGIQSAQPITIIGTYRNLEACRVDLGKAGGWCGKGCRAYGPGEIADCAPLIKVEPVR